MVPKELSAEEMVGVIRRVFNDSKEEAATPMRTMNRWLRRGDSIAVYRNEDFGHHELGRIQFVSYGSKYAQLEEHVPPKTMPDFGSAINWRYQLFGVYRGAILSLWED